MKSKLRHAIKSFQLLEDSEEIISLLFVDDIENGSLLLEDRLTPILQRYPLRLFQAGLVSALFLLLLPAMFPGTLNRSQFLEKLQKQVFALYFGIMAIEMLCSVSLIPSNQTTPEDLVPTIRSNVTSLLNLTSSQHLHFLLVTLVFGWRVSESVEAIFVVSLLPYLLFNIELILSLALPNLFYNTIMGEGKSFERGTTLTRHRTALTLIDSVASHSTLLVQASTVLARIVKLYKSSTTLQVPQSFWESSALYAKVLIGGQFLFSSMRRMKHLLASDGGGNTRKSRTTSKKTKGKKKRRNKSVSIPVREDGGGDKSRSDGESSSNESSPLTDSPQEHSDSRDGEKDELGLKQ